jgi:GT2 family glycosyltransferase
VLVVDQGSEDGSVEALETAFPEARILSLEKNVGVAAGRNLLASMAKGDLLWFLDNDAELPPDALSELLAGFEAHPEAAVLTMRVDNFF